MLLLFLAPLLRVLQDPEYVVNDISDGYYGV